MTREEVSELTDGIISKRLIEYSRRTVDEQQYVLLEAAERLKKDLWHPISEMPEEKRKILLVQVENENKRYVVATFENGKVVWNGQSCRLKLFEKYLYLDNLV